MTEGAHDELLFIVVHQSYELWFKLILHELAAARAALEDGRAHAATPPLRRVVAVERLLLQHLDVLETMSPDGFLEFRDPLAPASGFQSRQFRRIESESPELYDGVLRARPASRRSRDERLQQLAQLYRDHMGDPARAALHEVAELLVDHDEGIALWRRHHVLMAAREIGSRPGTGGSPGVPYLESTLGKRFYPELWDVRVEL